MTNESDSFINEVDESLRQDRIVSFFKNNAVIIAAGLFGIVVAVGGWQAYQHYRLEGARSHAEEYSEAQRQFQENNLADAKASFETLSTEGPGVYRAMAMMERAAILEQEGDLAGAVAGFDAAAEAASDPIMRDTARLRAAYIAADTQDFPALRTRLQPLVESDSRLSYLARELLAIEAWEAGEIDLARTTLENLQLAFEAPQAVQERARVALAVIGPAPEAAADGAASEAAPAGETK